VILHLSEERVRELLRWDRLIPVMESELGEFSLGRVLQPVRQMPTIEEGERANCLCR
jgi:thiomorpholine-carboxylate dehydrogenase